jgi:carbonic anhydrase/acetyltransferase-like protein (isoleucine patch superfamily)
MIHGCHIGSGTVVEPGAIVCDWSSVGRGCVVKAGSVVKQRDEFGDGLVLEGFPAKEVGRLSSPPAVPSWALSLADVATIARRV